VEYLGVVGTPAMLCIPCLRIVGNIVSGQLDKNIARLMKHQQQLIRSLKNYLNSNNKAIVKETSYVFSNIAAGGSNMVDALIQSPELIHTIVKHFNSHHLEVQRELAYSLCNIMTDGRYFISIIDLGVIPGFLSLLSTDDQGLISIILTLFSEILCKHPQGKLLLQQSKVSETLSSFNKKAVNEVLKQFANQILQQIEHNS